MGMRVSLTLSNKRGHPGSSSVVPSALVLCFYHKNESAHLYKVHTCGLSSEPGFFMHARRRNVTPWGDRFTKLQHIHFNTIALCRLCTIHWIVSSYQHGWYLPQYSTPVTLPWLLCNRHITKIPTRPLSWHEVWAEHKVVNKCWLRRAQCSWKWIGHYRDSVTSFYDAFRMMGHSGITKLKSKLLFCSR